MSPQPDADPGEPLQVWYASELLLAAMDQACMKFAVRRDPSGLTVVSPNGWSGDLREFIRFRGCHDYSGNEDKPAPADLVWNRLLQMAGIGGAGGPSGTIRIEQRLRYPHTDWTVGLKREGPDCLQFELTLERVDTSLPAQDGGDVPS